MSLRLTSADVPLDGVVARLGLPALHRHRIGEPMGTSGPLARRIAARHYASLGNAERRDAADVAAWIGRMTGAIEPVGTLVEDLRAERIAGLLWIAILGREPTPTPNMATDLVEAVSSLGLHIFLENYSTWDGEGDAPPKVWPSPSVHGDDAPDDGR